MDRRRLSPELCDLPDHRRSPRRCGRASAHVQDRRRGLHRRVGPVRRGAEPHGPDRRAPAPGPRRRRDVAPGALDHPGRAGSDRAPARVRPPGAGPGARLDSRPDRRRRPDRPRRARPGLALGVPDQRAGWARRPGRLGAGHPGVRLGERPQARPARGRARHPDPGARDGPRRRGPGARLARLGLRRPRRRHSRGDALRRRRAAPRRRRRRPARRVAPVRGTRVPGRGPLGDGSSTA